MTATERAMCTEETDRITQLEAKLKTAVIVRLLPDDKPLGDDTEFVFIDGYRFVNAAKHDEDVSMHVAENKRLHDQLDANLSAVDALLQQTARLANDMAVIAPGSTFDAIGAGAGVGIRLTAIEDVRKALVTLGLRAHESRGASDENQDGETT